MIMRFLLIFSVIFLVGCSIKESTIDPIGENKGKIIILENKLIELENKLQALEANQLTAEDMRALSNLQNLEGVDSNSVNIEGCPSDSDIDKWWEKMNEGDITQRQFDRILDKYNDCN